MNKKEYLYGTKNVNNILEDVNLRIKLSQDLLFKLSSQENQDQKRITTVLKNLYFYKQLKSQILQHEV